MNRGTSNVGEFDTARPVGSFVSTVRGVVLEPTAFFRGIERRGSVKNPVVFALVCSVLPVLVGAVATVLYVLVTGEAPSRWLFGSFFGTPGQLSGAEATDVGRQLVQLVFLILLSPVLALLGLYIGAALMHVLVWIFVRPENAGFERTLRVYAYATVTALVSWVPLVGWLASVYGLYLTLIGLRELHSTTTGKVVAVMVVPALLTLGSAVDSVQQFL